MNRTRWRYSVLFLLLGCGVKAGAQQALTWGQVRNRFENSNPTLLAGQFNISESKAQEITAYLRPNPNFTATADQDRSLPGRSAHLRWALRFLFAGGIHQLLARTAT